MQTPFDGATDVAKAIQLALAPVFLLTGIAGLLNVMTNRLSRIIDRGRMLTEGQDTGARIEKGSLEQQLETLEQRRHFTSIAITACTTAALLLCIVIVVLFLEALFGAPLRVVVGVVFMASVVALVVGLAYFLREVHAATKLRIGLPRSTSA